MGQAATVINDAHGNSFTARIAATGPVAWELASPSQSTTLPSQAYWTDLPDVLPNDTFGISSPAVSDPCENACSPFYGGVFGDPSDAGAPNWQTTPFFTVFDPKGVGQQQSAVLNFERPQNFFSLLWGSPDEENEVALLLGETIVGSFWGADFDWFLDTPSIITHPGSGAALLELTGLLFDSVRFSTWSEAGSFEFSNITTMPAPVPLPPTLIVLLTALGMGWLTFRRRSEDVSIA